MRGVDQDGDAAVFGGEGGVVDAVLDIEVKELAGGPEDGVAVDAFGLEELEKVEGGGGVDGGVVVVAGGDDGGEDSAKRFGWGGHYPRG